MTQKLLIFDCETTHLQSNRGCIHQLSALVVIDDKPVETIDLKIRPHEKAVIDPQALKVSGVTPEIINQYPHRSEQFAKFLELLNRYIDLYDPQDKFHLVGLSCEPF